jgi:flagellar L-ring protein precursor FlgH
LIRPRLVLASIALALPAALTAKKAPAEGFGITLPMPVVQRPANGAIFQAGSYTALTSGGRASRVGDLVTILLLESTSATKSNSAALDRTAGGGFSPPATGLLSLFHPSDVNMSGQQSFKGKGDAAQSNALNGAITVTVAEVYPNGSLLVRGEKEVTLNRGDERIQISGVVRSGDLNANNEVASTRVANAHIRYTGKGEVANASRQGWLQRFFSVISPF